MSAVTIMIRLAAAAVLTWLAASCVHEWPQGSEPIEPEKPQDVKSRKLRLHLTHDTAMDTLGIYDYGARQRGLSARSTIDEADAPHDVRHTVNLYPVSRSDVSRSPAACYTFTHITDDDCDETLELDVPLGDYRVVAWTDYVAAGTQADKYYDTTDFNEIVLATRGTHYGSNEWRKAWRGTADISIEGAEPTMRPDTLAVYEAEAQLTQPTARYTFISTDLRRFLEGGSTSRAANSIEDCTVKMVYTQYMCSAYNAITGKPADSWTGVSYDSRIEPTGNDEARIGFDHVFVNGDRTSVNVAVQVLDKQGNVLATIPGFDVPLERGRHTIVKGEFLTSTAGGSVGINPDFGGDFNIEIK